MRQPRRSVSPVHPTAMILGLLLMLPYTAQAVSNEDVRTYLISIHRLYESLEYERALDQVQLARQAPRGIEDEVALSLYEGIIQFEMGREEQCANAFKAALLLRSDAKLPVKVAPKIERIFESVRQQVKHELAPLLQKNAEDQQTNPPTLSPPPPRPDQPPAASSTVATIQPPGVPPSTVSSKASRRGGLRRLSLVPAIAGGTLLVAGGISWAISRGELNQLRNDDPRIATREDVQHRVSRGSTWQTVGVSLLGLGAAGLATAAGMYVLGASEQSVSLGVSTNGTSAFVHGRWP